jgi:hypothetical protein
MTIVVWIGIQDDEVIFAAVQYEVLFVPVLPRFTAEYAALRLLAEDVVDPPGCP